MRIWIDMDHAPHVTVFRRLIGELSSAGHEVLVTVRQHGHTSQLCDFWNIPHDVIGVHGGKHPIRKLANLAHRSGQLISWARRTRPDAALGHGSRTQLVASCLLRIPAVVMRDYEYTEHFIYNRFASAIFVPDLIPDERLRGAGFRMDKVRRFPGFKEYLYLGDFRPKPEFRREIGVEENAILVTLRPPGMVVHYHCPKAEETMVRLIERVLETPGGYPLIVQRTKEDRRFLEDRFGDRIRFLEKAVDGLQLIWHSDVLVSGGGTMNREAALLGTPVYSIFAGRKPYLDELLAEQGRLVFVDDPSKVGLVQIEKREIRHAFDPKDMDTVRDVARELQDVLAGLISK